jgi:twitching motility two-component system response regulator PilH
MRARTILFVGDILGDLTLQRTILEREDVTIVTEEHGAAVEAARRSVPEVVVVEVAPPQEAGIGTCRALKADAATRGIPAILVTPAERAGACRAAGADAVVFKPLAQQELLRAIGRFMALPERSAVRCLANLRFTFRTERAETGQAFSRSLSSAGAFLKSDRPMARGSRLLLRFHLPGDEREISCAAVVRNTTASEEAPGTGPGFGVEFLEIASNDRARLEAFVQSQSKRPFASW